MQVVPSMPCLSFSCARWHVLADHRINCASAAASRPGLFYEATAPMPIALAGSRRNVLVRPG